MLQILHSIESIFLYILVKWWGFLWLFIFFLSIFELFVMPLLIIDSREMGVTFNKDLLIIIFFIFGAKHAAVPLFTRDHLSFTCTQHCDVHLFDCQSLSFRWWHTFLYWLSHGTQTLLYTENPKKPRQDSRCSLQQTWKLSATTVKWYNSALKPRSQSPFQNKPTVALMSCFIIVTNQPVICHYVFPCIRQSGSNIRSILKHQRRDRSHDTHSPQTRHGWNNWSLFGGI